MKKPGEMTVEEALTEAKRLIDNLAKELDVLGVKEDAARTAARVIMLGSLTERNIKSLSQGSMTREDFNWSYSRERVVNLLLGESNL